MKSNDGFVLLVVFICGGMYFIGDICFFDDMLDFMLVFCFWNFLEDVIVCFVCFVDLWFRGCDYLL